MNNKWSEKNLDYIIELLLSEIEWVQENGRGISYLHNKLYKYLDENDYDYGFQTWTTKNGPLGGGHKMDFGVRRNLFSESTFFYIQNVHRKRFYIDKKSLEFKIGGYCDNFNKFMSMRDIWNQADYKLKIKNRNKLINEIIG